jgi:large conductance mechanosensitive channel
MLNEFKKFALRGNVMDLAVAVIIGAAFGKITASLVSDILMPLIGVLVGGISLTGLAFHVGDAVVGYGKFLQSVVDFIIIAFAIFLMLKVINASRRKQEAAPAAPAAPPAPTKEELLLTEIRDLLKDRALE